MTVRLVVKSAGICAVFCNIGIFGIGMVLFNGIFILMCSMAFFCQRLLKVVSSHTAIAYSPRAI